MRKTHNRLSFYPGFITKGEGAGAGAGAGGSLGAN